MTKAARMQENILLLRHRMGLTVQQFAKRIGLTESTFRNRYRQPGTFRQQDVWTMDSIGEKYGISITGGGEKRAAG